MKTLKNDWLIWIILIAPFVFIAIFWNQFPDKIPTHFNFSGEPDDYSDKLQGVLLMPGINILLYFLFLVLPVIDPSRKNYGLFQDKYKIIRIVLHLFFAFAFFLNAFYALGYNFNISFLIIYSTLVLFLILGNYLGNIRHNYFIGIRTPWTLANEKVWTKTHRFAAKIWVVATLITMVALPFFSSQISEFLFLAYLAVIAIIPIVYSYVVFKKIKNED
ncbi:MAG: hypothetical protein A3F72_05615 [Bacteroidetes bacterium RIFCSPLOWO2_12_FULL_35_15]|nr:MAG: hypothetical protein A3F72_05615 [Bacteroidetes bacterium RIFCSPLOWO2_12_FULL_35_15]